MLAQCVKCDTPVVGDPREWVTCECCGMRVRMPFIGQKITSAIIQRRCETHNCRLTLEGRKGDDAITSCPICESQRDRSQMVGSLQ